MQHDDPTRVTSQDQSTQGLPLHGASAEPSDFFPPQAPTPSSKKFGSTKVVASLLGIFVLLGGLATGVVLVGQQQMFEQQAGVLYGITNVCPAGLKCQATKFSFGSNSSISCNMPVYVNSDGVNRILRYDPAYCCSNPSDVIVNNKCVTGCPADQKNCQTGWLLGAAKCTDSKTLTQKYCCPEGKVMDSVSGCVNPLVAGAKCTYSPLGRKTSYIIRNTASGCSCEERYTCTSKGTISFDGKCYAYLGTSASCKTRCFTNGVFDATKCSF